MAITKQKFREIVFQMLFSSDFSSSIDEEMQEFMMKEFFLTKKTLKSAEEKKRQVKEKLEQIDNLLVQHSRSYDFDRISKTEKNIMRLCAFEMLYEKDVPPKVAIAEAIRLTRKYSTKESAAFVNAVLDSIYQSNLPKIDQQQNELSNSCSRE